MEDVNRKFKELYERPQTSDKPSKRGLWAYIYIYIYIYIQDIYIYVYIYKIYIYICIYNYIYIYIFGIPRVLDRTCGCCECLVASLVNVSTQGFTGMGAE